MTAAIEALHLTRDYGSVRALDRVDLTVPRGRATVLLGPNGAGKTTFVEIALGLRPPTAGSVRTLGHDPVEDGADSWRRRIGYLPQDVPTIDYLSGSEYIQLMTELYGPERAGGGRSVREAASLFDIGDTLSKRLGTYSTGMKKKVMLCALYLCRPELLILDEPFEGLDPHAVRRVQRWLSRVTDEGRTVLLSSHVLPLVEPVADKVAIIDRGSIGHVGDGAGRPGASGAPIDRRISDLEKLYFTVTGRPADV